MLEVWDYRILDEKRVAELLFNPFREEWVVAIYEDLGGDGLREIERKVFRSRKEAEEYFRRILG